MQRYMLTDYASASTETRAVDHDFMKTTGATAVPVWLQSLGHNAALARAYWERAKGTPFSGALPLPLKEMIVFVVSAKNGARYCSACHAQSVLSLDKNLSFGDLKSLANASSALGRCRITARWSTSPSRWFPMPIASTMPISRPCTTKVSARRKFAKSLPSSIWQRCSSVYTSALRLDLDPNYEAILYPSGPLHEYRTPRLAGPAQSETGALRSAGPAF